jgi:hypothetical protein
MHDVKGLNTRVPNTKCERTLNTFTQGSSNFHKILFSNGSKALERFTRSMTFKDKVIGASWALKLPNIVEALEREDYVFW